MNIEKLALNVVNSGHLTNTYLVYDENRKGILVDPADEIEKIISKIKELNLDIKYIVLTHGHFDHTNALYDIQKFLDIKVLIHKNDFDMLMGKVDDASSMFYAKPKFLDESNIEKVEDGFELNVGDLTYEIIHTPGHTAGSIVIYIKDKEAILTGDTLFEKSFGRCDLVTSDFKSMVNSLEKLFNKFDNEIIYPGHGESSKLNKTKKYIKLLLALRKN